MVFELLRSQMLIPYLLLRGVLIFLCEYQSFMIIDIVMSILFSTSVFLFRWIRSLQHWQDQLSVPLNNVCFIRSKLPLFFPPAHPFLLKDSDVLIKYHFILVKSLHSFSVNVLIRWFSEDSNGASSSSFFILFLLRWIQFKLLVFLYPCPHFKYFSCRCNS